MGFNSGLKRLKELFWLQGLTKRVMLDLQEGETARSSQASLLATLQGVISLNNYICITNAKKLESRKSVSI